MGSVAVATPRGDPCGEVPGADFDELPRPPQNYHGHNQYISVILMNPSNYLAGQIFFPPLDLELFTPLLSEITVT